MMGDWDVATTSDAPPAVPPSIQTEGDWQVDKVHDPALDTAPEFVKRHAAAVKEEKDDPQAHPKWDIPGDIKRAAEGSYEAMKTDAGDAFPSPEKAVGISRENRTKYGMVGGQVADAAADVGRLGHALKVPMNAAGILASPLTGLLHGVAGSAASYLPGMTKQEADDSIDGAGMMIAPEAGGVYSAADRAAFADTSAAKSTAKLQNKAIAKVNNRATNLTAQQVMDAQAAGATTGDKVTLMDLDKNMKGLAGSVYRAPGSAGADLGTFLKNRAEEAGPALQKQIGELANGSTFETFSQLQNARSAKAAPLYEKALNSPGVVNTPRVMEFLADPDIQAGIRRGIRLEKKAAITEGRPFVDADYGITGWDENGDAIMGDIPTKKSLAVAKEGLDAIISDQIYDKGPSMGRPTKEGYENRRLQKEFVKELEAAIPGYKEANAAWSGDSASLNALNSGRDHFMRGETDAQVLKEFNDLSDGDKELYRMGAAEERVDRLRKAPRNADKSKRVANSDAEDGRWRMLFPDQGAADQFLASVQRKKEAFDTKNKVTGGSDTAERGNEDLENMQTGIHAAHGLLKAVGGNPLGALGSFVRAKRDLGLRNNPKLNAEIAKILQNPSLALDPNANTLLPEVDYRAMLRDAKTQNAN